HEQIQSKLVGLEYLVGVSSPIEVVSSRGSRISDSESEPPHAPYLRRLTLDLRRLTLVLSAPCSPHALKLRTSGAPLRSDTPLRCESKSKPRSDLSSPVGVGVAPASVSRLVADASRATGWSQRRSGGRFSGI